MLRARTLIALRPRTPLTLGTRTSLTVRAIPATRPVATALRRPRRAISREVPQRDGHVHRAGEGVLLHEQLDRRDVLRGRGRELALGESPELAEPGEAALRGVSGVGEKHGVGHAGRGAVHRGDGLPDEGQVGETRRAVGGHERPRYAGAARAHLGYPLSTPPPLIHGTGTGRNRRHLAMPVPWIKDVAVVGDGFQVEQRSPERADDLWPVGVEAEGLERHLRHKSTIRHRFVTQVSPRRLCAYCAKRPMSRA